MNNDYESDKDDLYTLFRRKMKDIYELNSFTGSEKKSNQQETKSKSGNTKKQRLL